MSVNLVSLAFEAFGPDVCAKIASALGVNSNTVSKAVAAALPAIIGSLAGVASTPNGANKIDQAISRQGPGILDSVFTSIGGSGQQPLVSGGIDTLKSILGGSVVPGLSEAVAKFANMDKGASSSLVGLLSPAVMGLLAKQKDKQHLDASGLARLLGEQKNNVKAALPSGFANLLADAGFSDVPGVTSIDVARKAGAASVQRAAKTTSFPSWLWIIALLALAGIAWWYFAGRGQDVAQQGQTAVEQAASNLIVNGVDLGSTLEQTFEGLKTTLGGVTDVPSAQAALPKLDSTVSELEKISGLAGNLPAAGKAALASLIAAAMPTINDLFDKVLAVPGVSEVAKPQIDAVRRQLDALGTD